MDVVHFLPPVALAPDRNGEGRERLESFALARDCPVLRQHSGVRDTLPAVDTQRSI